MGSLGEPTYGIIRFGVPDLSIPASDRGIYAFPPDKEIVEQKVELHDARTSTDIVKGPEGIVEGPEGLDIQGFTYIKHHSALSDASWFMGQNVEEVYFREVEELLCKVTGAKRVVFSNVLFRRRVAERHAESKLGLRKDSERDKELARLSRHEPIVYGREAGSFEPARGAHIDYSLKGVKDTARYCRKDIAAAGSDSFNAEDAVSKGQQIDVPRYAAYSVWRPLKTVKRDPLAVCDWRSIQSSELQKIDRRALSNINDSGEYLLEAYAALPPEKQTGQKWYWRPQQTEDEVLIVKFADTASENDPNIAGGCLHCSPILLGTEEEEEPRCSIECRVLAFW